MCELEVRQKKTWTRGRIQEKMTASVSSKRDIISKRLQPSHSEKRNTCIIIMIRKFFRTRYAMFNKKHQIRWPGPFFFYCSQGVRRATHTHVIEKKTLACFWQTRVWANVSPVFLPLALAICIHFFDVEMSLSCFFFVDSRLPCQRLRSAHIWWALKKWEEEVVPLLTISKVGTLLTLSKKQPKYKLELY